LQRLRTFVFAADAYVVRFDVQYAMHANDTQRFEHAGRFTRRAADGHAVAVNLQQEWARLVGVNDESLRCHRRPPRGASWRREPPALVVAGWARDKRVVASLIQRRGGVKGADRRFPGGSINR